MMTFEVNSSFLNSLFSIRSYFEKVIQILAQRVFPATPENHIDCIKNTIENIIQHLETVINNLKQFLNQSGFIGVEIDKKPTTPDFLEVLPLEEMNNNQSCNTLKVIESSSGDGGGGGMKSLPDCNKGVDLPGEKPILRPKPVFRSKSCLQVDKGKVSEFSPHNMQTATSNSICTTTITDTKTTCESSNKARNENSANCENICSGTSKISIRSYSLKHLEEWENLWEENESPFETIRRRYKDNEKEKAVPVYTVSGRIRQFEQKHKRISSTVEGFLDIFDYDKNTRNNKLKINKTNVLSTSLTAIPSMEEEEEEEEEKENEDECSVTSEAESEDKYESSIDSEQESISETKRSSLLTKKAKSLGNLTKKNCRNRIMFDFATGNVSRSKSDRLPRIVDVIYKKKPV